MAPGDNDKTAGASSAPANPVISANEIYEHRIRPPVPAPVTEHKFDASRIKIARARKHLAELRGLVATYIASDPVSFLTEIVRTEERTEIRWTMNSKAAPEETSAVVGDVIHNLRSALDLMACELVRAAGGSDDDVYFPFAKQEDEFDEMIKRRRFDRAGKAAVELLCQFKPYRGGNLALRALHDLNIRDKHQSLIPNVFTAAGPIIRMWDDDGTPNPIVMGDPSKPTELKVVFPEDCALKGQELVPTLEQLVELVDGIVQAFRALANITK